MSGTIAWRRHQRRSTIGRGEITVRMEPVATATRRLDHGDSGDKPLTRRNTTLTLSRQPSFERSIRLIVELCLSPSELNS